MNITQKTPSVVLTALFLVALVPIGAVNAVPTVASEFYYGVEYDWSSVDTDLENLTGLDVPEIFGEVMGAADDAGLHLILGQLQTGSSNVYIHHTENIMPQTIQDNDGKNVSVWSRTDDVTLRHGILADSILQTDWSETIFGTEPKSFDINMFQSLEQVLTVDMTYTEYLDTNSDLVGADMIFSMATSIEFDLNVDALFEGGGEEFPIDFDSTLSAGYSITDSTSQWRLNSPDSIYVDISSNDNFNWDCHDCGSIDGNYTGTFDYLFSLNGIPTEDFGLDVGEFDLDVSDSLTNSGTFDMDVNGEYDFDMGESLTVDLGDGEGMTTQVQSCESCLPGNPLMFLMMGHVLAGSGESFAQQITDDIGEELSDGLASTLNSVLGGFNAEGNTDGNLALYVFDGEDASGSPSDGTDDNLIRIAMTQGGDINWEAVSVNISVNNGAPITCGNTPSSTAGCVLVEYGDVGDQVWSVGDGVTIKENGVDICSIGCDIEFTITDTWEGKTLDESSGIQARSMSSNDSRFICDNGNDIPLYWYDDGYDDCGDRSDEPNMPYPSDKLETIARALSDSNLQDVLEQFALNLENRLELIEPFDTLPYNDAMWAPLWSNEHASMVGVGVYVMNETGSYTMAGPVTEGYSDDLPAKLSIRYLSGLDANTATNGMEDAVSLSTIVDVKEHDLADIVDDLESAGIDVTNFLLPPISNTTDDIDDQASPTAEELAEEAGIVPFLSPITMIAIIALAGVVAGNRQKEHREEDDY